MDADKAKSDREKRHEKFIRWQGITITQLSYSINLILTLSVAAIGFGTTLPFDDNLNTVASIKSCYIVAILVLLFSAGLGIYCTMNRLVDFRTTARITKLKRKRGTSIDRLKANEEEIKKLRAKTKGLGEFTWCLFQWQIGTFCLGVLLLVLATYFYPTCT